MESIKSLADQLREQLVKPNQKEQKLLPKAGKKVKQKEAISDILLAMQALDTSQHKSMVHVRFDEKTVRTMNHFKMATGVDVTRFVAFAVSNLLQTCPDLKLIIKHFIQNQEL